MRSGQVIVPMCPGSHLRVDHECGANFCSVCERPVIALAINGMWIAEHHEKKPTGECSCGLAIYDPTDYLCETCRNTDR